MDQPSSEFSLSQPPHSAQSLLHLDLSSDLPSWRSGIGNGRFTVDGGGGAPALQLLSSQSQPQSQSQSQSQSQPQSHSQSQSHSHLLKPIVNHSLQPPSSTQPLPQPQPQSLAQASSQAASPNQFITNSNYHHHHPHHQHQQPIQFANLVTQLPLPDGPSSLPSHLGWNSQQNPLNFGSVPNSPVFGLGINNQLDLLSNQSIDHHNPFGHLNSAPFGGTQQSQSPFLAPSKPQDLPLHQPFGGPKSLLNFHQSEGYDPQLSSLSQGLPGYANPAGVTHPLAALVAHHAATGSSFSPASATADSPGLPAAPSEPDSYSRLTSPLEPSALQLPLPSDPPGRWDHHSHSAPADSPGAHHTLSDEPSLGTLNGGPKAYGEPGQQSAWPLRDPNPTVLASPQSAGYSPFSPSPPYSPWSGLGAAEERPGALPPSSRAGRETLARQLWTLYGPGDRGVPTGDALESLVRRLTELGLDVDQIRQQLNGPGWARSLAADKEPQPGWPAQRAAAQKSVAPTGAEAPAGAGDEKVPRQALRDHLQQHHPHQQARLEKITENVEEACKFTQGSLKSPLFGREPSIERGRRSAVQAGRPACNLAGRWQESMNVDSVSPMVVEMDWRAHSRSRSRPPETTNMDWRQASRSRSRRQELRLDLPLSGVRLEGEHSGMYGFETAYGSAPPAEPASAPDLYQQGLIEQLIGSYQAQQSEEDRLQALSAESERRTSGLFGPPCSAAAGLGGPSAPTGTGTGASSLSEFDFGALDFPLRPSHHSLLGSIPGLTQDFAKLANAHAEYGSIPRLVRKTSFDEILAQQHQHQHHQKRGAGHTNAGEAGEDEPLGRAGVDARPNTATDEGALGRMHVKVARDGTQEIKTEEQDPDCALISVTSPPFKRLGFFSPPSSTAIQGLTRPMMMASSPERREEAGAEFLDGFGADEEAAFRRVLESTGGLFGAGGTGGMEHVRPYEVLRMDGFGCSAGGGDGRARWMTEGVAPGAVEVGLAGRGMGVGGNACAESRSSRSSSSGSSLDGPASKPLGPTPPVNQPQSQPQPQTVKMAQMKREEAKAGRFSGGRSSHVSSIGEARKRTKQLPYSSGEPVGIGVGVGLGNGVLGGSGASGNGGSCGPNVPGSGGGNGSGSGGGGNGHVTQCLNCQTKETPLWRRDSDGRPLCNACGLFANLHGIPRPAALSTGIIKRRNRGKNGEKNNQQQLQQQGQQQQQGVKVTGSMANGAPGKCGMSSPNTAVGMGPATGTGTGGRAGTGLATGRTGAGAGAGRMGAGAGVGRTGAGGSRTAAGAKEVVKVHHQQRPSGSGSGNSGSSGSGHGLGACTVTGGSGGGQGLGAAGGGADGCLVLAQHHQHQLCHQQDEQQSPPPPQPQVIKKKK